MPPSFVMIDAFLANPHELRRQALGLGYDTAAKDAGANYPGTVSAGPLPIAGLDDHVSRLAGVPLTGAPGFGAGPDDGRLVDLMFFAARP